MFEHEIYTISICPIMVDGDGILLQRMKVSHYIWPILRPKFTSMAFKEEPYNQNFDTKGSLLAINNLHVIDDAAKDGGRNFLSRCIAFNLQEFD